ncbi:hypothetical protein [Phaeocystidibacter marisrubri]|uniref:Transglutaminase-like domain-containing protein n=1 Tax=Phaeocystidibacter marisrubri TaxID=1577780 RepID=A0A6L3ZCJ1_9FLAO|nr:hypothetical protein [Phaeocystidibacter marisrubri]KAB2815581.1 hypothetical protein F8C82_07715 [Phaeocystidibacter marisrubri]
MLTPTSKRNMHEHGFNAIGFISGSLFGAVHFVSVEAESILDAQLPLTYRILVFVLVTFAGGVLGNFGKDFYDRFFKFKKKNDNEKLNGPGTAISSAHYRPLSVGLEYSPLIPSPQGNRIQMETGNTDTTLKIMDRAAREYAHEASELSKKLIGSTRYETVKNIKNFLYNHFQYLADTDWQLIRVLSRAWADREKGIDCKSFSVIASQILLELGIPHYFARIKQQGAASDGPNYATQWSHVFVVVPKRGNSIEESNPNSYWVIDGVPSYDHVPPHTEINFYPMLKHAVLNGPTSGLACSTPTSSLPQRPIISEVQRTGEDRFVLMIASEDQPSNVISKSEISGKQLQKVCQLGCPFTPEAIRQLSGLGEPISVSAIIAATTAIANALGPLFSGSEQERYESLKTQVYSKNWPNVNGVGWKNFRQAGIPDLQAAVTEANARIERLKGRIDRGEYSSRGEERVWNRYLLVYSEALREIATHLDTQLSTTSGGDSVQVGTNLLPGGGNLPNVGTNNTPTTVKASFGSSILGWLAVGGIAFGAYKALSSSDKPDNKPVKATV